MPWIYSLDKYRKELTAESQSDTSILLSHRYRKLDK